MTSFEEEFPELNKMMDAWSCEEDSGFYPEDIEKFCLNKQRVREAIDNKIRILEKLLQNENENILVNELGCRVAIANLKEALKELSLDDEKVQQ
jgi:hypothetical protein